MKIDIICGDCLEVLPHLPAVRMVFMDPPDNIGMKYEVFRDKWPDSDDYFLWLFECIEAGQQKAPILWLSYNVQHYWPITRGLLLPTAWTVKPFIWRYTFGQHNSHDCGSGYRPMLRLSGPGVKYYPDAIRVESARQRAGDKRADPRGRVPDDVWEFPRIVGNARERRSWHPNQHPEALMERMIKLCCKPGDLVIDMYAGTGTTLRVCDRLGINCIGIDISPPYCEHIADELGIEVST